MRRDFHIIATYINTYKAAMHKSNNTIKITQFISSNLSHMIKQNKTFYTTVCRKKTRGTKGIVIKCHLMPLIGPQSTSPLTNDQHPNQSSVNAQWSYGHFFLFKQHFFLSCSKSKKSSSREFMLFTLYITCDDRTKHTQCIDQKC